jgi:glycosyltransferase involved in cell wall biosynthesis
VNDPRVSVVMPFLNQESFIAESIESVLAQRFQAWELLMVDDGSTDASSTIALQYAERHPGRVRYFEHDEHANLGASASRNLALTHARGDFIAFLDADDVYLPENLELLVDALEKFPAAGLVCTAAEYWYSWTGEEDDRRRDYVSELGLNPGEYQPPELLMLYLGRKVTTPCTCSILVRRSAIDESGAFEQAFRSIYTDQVFYVKLALHVPIVILSGCWARYRQHPDSACHLVERQGKANQARLMFLSWVRLYFRQQEVSSPLLEAVLRSESVRCRKLLWRERLHRLRTFLAGTRSLGLAAGAIRR